MAVTGEQWREVEASEIFVNLKVFNFYSGSSAASLPNLNPANQQSRMAELCEIECSCIAIITNHYM